jgi:hypothetical protein
MTLNEFGCVTQPGAGRPPSRAVYRGDVTDSPLSAGELRAAAETHKELGPEYRDAVLESFVERVGREIDARVDARLAQAAVRPVAPQPAPAPPARQPKSLLTKGLAGWSGCNRIDVVAVGWCLRR